MELGTLFNFAILLFCGLIFAKIIRYFKLPDVTGYLIGGLIIGPVSYTHLDVYKRQAIKLSYPKN